MIQATTGMTEKQKKTYEDLLKIPSIYQASYPNGDEDVYLKIIGQDRLASIKVHRSGDFSFVVKVGKHNNKYRYIKRVDNFMERLFPETMVGLAYHLDKLYRK